MGKAIKRILIGIGILLLLLIAAAVIIPFVFKDKIIELGKSEANRRINAKIDFDNDIDISILHSFPNLTLGVNNLKIINNAPFQGDTLVYIPGLKTTLDIMTVIRGEKIQVKSFEMNKPYINLQVTKEGIANWDIAFPDQDSLAKAGKDTTSNFRMGLKHYAINDAKIRYDDRALDMFAYLDSFTHVGNGDFNQDIFDLSTKTDINKMTVAYGGIRYLNEVLFKLDADMNVNMKESKYTFKENEMKLNDLALKFDGFVAMPNDEDINMDMKFESQKASFKSLLSLIPAIYKKDFKNLKTSGQLAMKGDMKGTYNEKNFPAYNVFLNVDNGMFQYPDLPTAVTNVDVDANIKSPGGDFNNTVINVSKANFSMAGEPFRSHMIIRTPVSDPYIDGAIKGKIVLEKMKDIIKLEPGTEMAGLINADVTMKGNMSSIEKEQYDKFNAAGTIDGTNIKYVSKDFPEPVSVSTVNMAFNPKDVKVSNLNMMLGKSDIKGEGSLHNLLGYMLKDQKLRGTFTMVSNYFNANAFASEDPNEANKPVEQQKPSAVEIPENIDFTLNSTMNEVIYDKWDIRNFKGTVVVRDKKLEFNGVNFNLLGGSFAINGFYDSKNIKAPTTNLKLNIKNVSIPETFKAFNTVQQFAPIAKYMSGNISADLDFNTVLGPDMMPDWKTLSSYGRLILDRAVVENFMPLKSVADQLKIKTFDKLELKGIRPSYKIENGRFSLTDVIKFNVEDIKAEVTGSNGLDKTLDYVMGLDIPAAKLSGQAGDAISNALGIKGVSLPKSVKANVLFGGTIDHPTVKVSLKDMVSGTVDALKDKAKEELEKKKKELEDKAKGEIDKQKQRLEEEKRKAEEQARQKVEQEKKRLEEEKRKVEEETRRKADEEKKRLEEEAKKKLKGIFNK